MKFKLQPIQRSIFLLLALLPVVLCAHDFEMNGIFYNINGTNATVTYKGSSYNSYSNEYSGSVTVPSNVTYNGTTYSVTGIENEAFRSCNELTGVTIPASVTSIGNYAFNGCSSLMVLWVPNSVKSIGNWAFGGCSELAIASIGESVTKIGYQAFSGCSSLSTIIIPETVKEIGTYVFKNCFKLKTLYFNAVSCDNFNSYSNEYPFSSSCIETIIIGDKVNVIPSNFACRLASLKTVIIGNSVTAINPDAFEFCSGLTSVTIGNSVTTIGPCAFSGCTGLTSVTIPNSVTTIGNAAFSGCTRLTNLLIGQSVAAIDWNSFYRCTNLSSIEVANGNTTYDSRNNSNAIIETATNTLKVGCKTTIIPNSVTAIGRSAFSGCRGISITIPSSVCSIDIGAFSECNLSEIKCLRLTPPTAQNNSFDNQYSARLYVPYGSIDKYSETIPWSYFSEIIGGDDNIYVSSSFGISPTTCRFSQSCNTPIANAYILLNIKEKYDGNFITGLAPNTSYSANFVIETGNGKIYNKRSFKTPELSMAALTARMLTNTTAMLMAETNMADEETSCGFEWRRYDAPAEMPSTKVYCPVYGGTMAGTLKNLSENVYYKYRPFYKSSKGNEYYGDWIAFITADAGVVFEPVVYTYSSPEVSQTEATLQGVALRGSDDITEQGFEYWQAGQNNMLKASSVKKVTAKGERMSATVTGLQPGTAYKFRAYAIAGGKTTRGAEVGFVTESTGLDVNGDGVVNISDLNAIISAILAN